MVWLHGPTAEGLQWALRELRRARLFRVLLPTWNAMGVHRDAEFNKAHVPGFLRTAAGEVGTVADGLGGLPLAWRGPRPSSRPAQRPRQPAADV